MHTIIVPIDGSGSERALPVARKLAAQFDARMVLVHVQERMVAGRGGRIPARLDEAERLARVRELVTRLHADGIDAEFEAPRSILEHPADVIARTASRHDADAIVLASRGHAPIVGVLASSVAQRLLHAAPCPVLVVTPGAARTAFGRAADTVPAAA
ncbi:MAG TPA: universal stress protein [Gaiellales bacterium]|jgi:nucleotide-binding universal stress UspA family protein|nr:universal stress protein [Gaiellales bacterium]